MVVKVSAGIVLYRRRAELEVLLGHMGGPIWARRDFQAWSIPKGEYDESEAPLDAARREFREELGLDVPLGELVALEPVRQRSGKIVSAWAVEGDLDVAAVDPGTFEMEWPPKSGRTAAFPEIDRAEWFDLPTARRKIVAGQVDLLDQLLRLIGSPG